MPSGQCKCRLWRFHWLAAPITSSLRFDANEAVRNDCHHGLGHCALGVSARPERTPKMGLTKLPFKLGQRRVSPLTRKLLHPGRRAPCLHQPLLSANPVGTVVLASRHSSSSLLQLHRKAGRILGVRSKAKVIGGDGGR